MQLLKFGFPLVVLVLFLTDIIHGNEAYVLLTAAVISLISGIWNLCPFTGNASCSTDDSRTDN